MITEVGRAFANAATTAMPIDRSCAIQAGDVVLAVACQDVVPGTIVDNNGSFPFTIYLQEVAAAVTAQYMIAARRVLSAAEPETWNFTSSSALAWGMHTRTFRGVDESIWEVKPSQATKAISGADSDPAISVDMYIGTPGSMGIIVVINDSGSVVFSAPTNSYDHIIQPPIGRPNASCIRPNLAAGWVGTVNVTLGAVQDWTIHHFALKPAPDRTLDRRQSGGMRPKGRPRVWRGE